MKKDPYPASTILFATVFQTRTRNEELGNAIYYEMFETLFGKEDRQLELRSCFRYDITDRATAGI